MPKRLGRKDLLAVFGRLEEEDKIRVFENCCGTVSTSYDVMKEEFALNKNKQFVGGMYFAIHETYRAVGERRLCLGVCYRDFDDESPSGIESTLKIGHAVVARLTAAGFQAEFDNPIIVKNVPKEALPPL